jgi:hypothetical protein
MSNELLSGVVLPDEIDEDPPKLYAIDADDPDGGRNTIPVDYLAGCHVEIVYMPEQAAIVDAEYRAEHDPEGLEDE